MTRVVGVDPGTVSIDVCGLMDGQLYLDESWPTAEALANPEGFLELLTSSGVPELIAGPSGYGLPLIRSGALTEDHLRLAFLAPPGEPGGIEGLRSLVRQLNGSGLAVVYTPGVIHLPSVPQHRKLNRIDMGTADKVCAAILGIHEECRRQSCRPEQVSFILLELGGAFTAGLAIEQGRIVDGIGGTSGPLGWQAAGALDGEVAFLAEHVTKASLFQGGVITFVEQDRARQSMAEKAYVEGAAKAVRQLRGSAPSAGDILVSGRNAAQPQIIEYLSIELADIGTVRLLRGFTDVAKQGAQGAALVADGLAGGQHTELVMTAGLAQAGGTVLDHLGFISPEAGKQRLGLIGG
ncbi:MAG TPA: DUF1464 family protein [Gemmatimonadales bacterium]|nr:DUF1464 family protein [Gemmatimonadales bacterium]